jgi:putative N-acetyltransferase (TIGR04045 family)
MLELANVWGQRVSPFLSPVVTAQIASEPWQLAAYRRIRRDIFVHEQGLFIDSDLDEHDEDATAIVALSQCAGAPDEVIGVVRIYPAGAHTWFGGRLGVSMRYRARRIVGTALIFAAVSTARAWGCQQFLATVQARNVRYFEQHRFSRVAPVEICGHAHQLIRADLEAFPSLIASAAYPVDGRALVLPARVRAA